MFYLLNLYNEGFRNGRFGYASALAWVLFAIISAIAFTTVLGTVSGLILASSGAVAHDLLEGCVAGLRRGGPQTTPRRRSGKILRGCRHKGARTGRLRRLARRSRHRWRLKPRSCRSLCRR